MGFLTIRDETGGYIKARSIRDDLGILRSESKHIRP